MANYNFTYNDGSLLYKDAEGNECEIGSGDSNQLTVNAVYSDGRTTLTGTWNEIHEKISAGVPCWLLTTLGDEGYTLVPLISVSQEEGIYFVSTSEDNFGTDSPDGYPYFED